MSYSEVANSNNFNSAQLTCFGKISHFVNSISDFLIPGKCKVSWDLCSLVGLEGGWLQLSPQKKHCKREAWRRLLMRFPF